MPTSPPRQIPIALMVWLRSYRRAPWRLILVALAIAASALTFVTGWNLALALDHARPAAPAQAYLMLAAGAGTEARSFIPQSTYELLRTGFSAAPALRGQVPRGALVLPADIVVGEPDREERLPTLLRGLQTDADGKPAGLTLTSGRHPLPGRRELLLSPALSAWLGARQPGDTLKLARFDWRIVGVARRAGAGDEVEMYSTLPALRQHFQVSDIVSSVSMTLDPAQLAQVRQLCGRIKGSRLELLQLNSYGGRYIDQLQAQIKRFWITFLLLTMTLTGFGIHTVALALEAERDKVRQLALMLGFMPQALRFGEIIEGSVIGAFAAALAVLLYAALCRNLQLQSLLPSGAVSLSLHASLSGTVLTLVMGAGVGACMFAWSPARGAPSPHQ
ncbi:hypothetical protein JOD97_000541 [Duganella sp. 1411]|uniref:ABC transporter permease n=1 Tax=Duganella sp. 1411 TaxID=2806572 RepID=UPI001AE7CA0E|nr:ABC transporter permease [Duganella sp. 1411]MBP1202527.1 hypothetical protein [Duganella sp. 1411]